MAGEDVLLRIGADLAPLEAALNRAVAIATAIPKITLFGQETIQAAAGLTASLNGVKTASEGVVQSMAGVDTASKTVASSAATAGKAVADGGKAFADAAATAEKSSAGIGRYSQQLLALDAIVRKLQGARIGGPEMQQSIDQLSTGLQALRTTGETLDKEVFEPIRTKGTLAMREAAGQTALYKDQIAATGAESKKFFDTAILQSNALAQVGNEQAATAEKQQVQQEQYRQKSIASRQKQADAQAQEYENDRKFAAQQEVLSNKQLQAIGKESAARDKLNADIIRQNEAGIAAIKRRADAEAAAAEKAAIVGYQQQQALKAQQASMLSLPQTPAVVGQLKATDEALAGIGRQANLLPLQFRQLNDANKELIGSFQEINKHSSALFNPGMIGRVIQVGLAFKGLTIALDVIKGLGDVDRQLSLIAGTIDNVSDRQRVLAESSRMIFDVMKQTGRSADEAGQLVLELQRAFGDSAESLQAAYIPALALTIQKETDTAATIKILIGLYNNFGATLQGVSTEQEKYLLISDMVLTAANKSAIGINDFVTALGFVSKPATDALVPLNDLLAMMSLMGERSVRASTIGTGLRQVFHDVAFEADRVAAAFEVAVDRANPQPYVLLQTIMKNLGTEVATTGRLTADSMDRIKKAFPGTQELAGFNVLFEIFPQLAERSEAVATGFGATQRVLDEFRKSIGAASSALLSELLQAIDAFFGGDIPGKFEGITSAVDTLAAAFRTLRDAIMGARNAVKFLYDSLVEYRDASIRLGVGGPGGMFGGALVLSDADIARLKQQEETLKLVAKAREDLARSGQYGPPSPFLGPTAPPAIQVPLKPTVDTTAVKTGLDKLKADADNILREKALGNIELSVSMRIGIAEEDRAEAQKIVDSIKAKVAQGIPYDADTAKAFKEAQTNVENMTNKISALRKEGVAAAKTALKLELKAPEGQTIQDVIDDALKEFKDTDLVLPYRIKMAEGALEEAKAEQARIRAITERVGLGEETRPALRAATAKVGQLTADVNKLQAQAMREYTVEVEDQIKAQDKLAEALAKVESEWVKSQKAIQNTTDFSRKLEQINEETLAAIEEVGKKFMDETYNPVAYAAAVDKIYKTGLNKHDEFLNALALQKSQADDALATELENAIRPEGDAFILKIRAFAENLDLLFATTAEGIRDTNAEAQEIAEKTGKFIDTLTGAAQAERELQATAAAMNLIGVEAAVATQAILLTGKSIEALAGGTDVEKRIAESIRRAAVAADANARLILNASLSKVGLGEFTNQIRDTNLALDKEISQLNLAADALAKYNNRARDTAIAQAKLDQEVARFAGDTLGYLAARLREAEASMKPLLEAIGDGLTNVLQAAERATSDFFFNAFQGNIKSAKEAFADFGKSILRELSNVLASAVVKDFLGLFTGKGFSGEGLIGGLIGAIASIFGAGGSASAAASGVGVVPGVGSGPGAVYGPPSFSTAFPNAGAGAGSASIAALTGSLTTLAPAVLQIAGVLGVPGAGALGGMMGVLPLIKEIPKVFAQIAGDFGVVESVLGGIERIGIGSGVGAVGSIIGLIGGMIGDHDVALAGSLVSALGTFSKVAYGIGELVYGAATGGAAAAIGGAGAIGALDAGAEVVAGAGLLTGAFDGLAAGTGLLSGIMEGLGAVFSAMSAVALPLAVVSLPLIFGFFEDMGREEINWQRIQKERASAGFTGDVYKRGAQLEQQMRTAGPASVKQEILNNQVIRRDLSILAAEAINQAGFLGPVVEAIKKYGDSAMQVAQQVLVDGFGAMSFDTASLLTSFNVMTEPQRILDELNYFLVSVEKFGIKAANIDVDLEIGKNWQGALGGILGMQTVIEAYNDLFQAIDPSTGPGGGPGTPGTPPVSDDARRQNQLLLNTALAVNVAFKALTDTMGLSHQAAVNFGEVIDGIPKTFLEFGSLTTEITHATEEEINKLLDHMGEVLNFEQFVVGIKKITDVLKLDPQAQILADTTIDGIDGIYLSMKNLGDVLKNWPVELPPGIAIPVHDTPEGPVAKDSADLIAEMGDTISKGFIDISELTKTQMDYLRKVIIDGLTKALVAAPEKIVGIMDLEKLKKEGETVEQAGQRLGTAFANIGAAMKRTQLQADLAAGRTDEVTLAIKAYDKAQADLLTAAGPEELLAAATALEQAIPRVFQTMIDAVQKLDAEIHRIDLAIASAANEFLHFSVVAETLDLSKATDQIQYFYYGLATLEGRLAALPAVLAVLGDAARRATDAVYYSQPGGSLASPTTGGSPLLVVDAIHTGLAQLVPLADIFKNTLLEASSIKDPTSRMQAINAFVGQVDSFYQSVTSGIHMMYDRAREDVHTLFEAERERQAKIKADGQKTYEAIQKGLRDQKEWAQKESQNALERIREESDERLKALQKQKEAGQKQSQDYLEGIREAADAQKEALQGQIDALEESINLSKEWAAAVEKIHDTILDLTLGSNSRITNPQQRLVLARAEFAGAQASYAAKPTAEAAEKVSDLGRRVIDALGEVYPRAGGSFDQQSQAVLLVLQEIENQAKSRVGDQEAMVIHLKAMRDSLDAIGKATEAEIKRAEKLTEAFTEEMDRLIELERETTEAQTKEIQSQTEEYIAGIDRQIEAYEKGYETWLGELEEADKALSKTEKEWLTGLSAAEQADIQAVKDALQPLMSDAADKMAKAAREAELQRIALEEMRDAITGGTPTDIWISARMADMVALQGALPSQIQQALATQVGSYLSTLLTSLGFHEKGTAYVPHTTLAQVHKGEMIITAGDSDLLRRYGIKIEGGGGGNTISQNNIFNVSGVSDPEALIEAIAERVTEKLRGSLGSDIIQRASSRRWW